MRAGRQRSKVVGAPLLNPFVDCWSASIGIFPRNNLLVAFSNRSAGPPFSARWQPARPSPGPPSIPLKPFMCAALPSSVDVLLGEWAAEPRRTAAGATVLTTVAAGTVVAIACWHRSSSRAGLAEGEFGTTLWDHRGPASSREVGIGLRRCRLCRVERARGQTTTADQRWHHLWCRDEQHNHHSRRHAKRTWSMGQQQHPRQPSLMAFPSNINNHRSTKHISKVGPNWSEGDDRHSVASSPWPMGRGSMELVRPTSCGERLSSSNNNNINNKVIADTKRVVAAAIV